MVVWLVYTHRFDELERQYGVKVVYNDDQVLV
jgi:hypothetical protein